jgi:hypothetical protein
MVALRKARLTNGPLLALRWVLALTLCLGIGLHLAMPGRAWGISGFASGGTAVGAQYPDSGAAGPKPEISDLAEVMGAIRSSLLGDPAQQQAAYRALVHRDLQALSSGAGFDLRQTGSIALLIAAMAVLLVGGVLRWRRGHP